MDVPETTSVSIPYHSMSKLFIRLPARHMAYTGRLLVRVPTSVGGVKHHSIYGCFAIAESRIFVREEDCYILTARLLYSPLGAIITSAFG